MALQLGSVLIKFSIALAVLATGLATDSVHIKSEIDTEASEQNLLRGMVVECNGSGFADIFSVFKNTLAEAGNREEIISTVIRQQINSTAECLAPVIELLKEENVPYAILPITNSLHIHSPLTKSLVSRIESVENVLRVRADRILGIGRPILLKPTIVRPTGNKTWNTGTIDARCRSIKQFGENVHVGIIDSGVLYNHTELIDNWFGKLHAGYGFFDATSSSRVGASSVPTDSDGSGTNLMGIAVGKNIGVAPNATWTLCKACQGTSCSEAALETCAVYMTCPWKYNDASQTGDCTLGAKVVLFPHGQTIVGGQMLNPDLFAFYKFVRFWNSAGILSVFAMGDNGPDCNSAMIPGAFDISLSVGAIDENCNVWDDSSRGPVLIGRALTNDSTADGTCPALTGSTKCSDASNDAAVCKLTKPDLVAPGNNVRTSSNTDTKSFATKSGTGIAAAHVAGVLALMISANPGLKWNYQIAYTILTGTADTTRLDQQGSRKSSQRYPAGSHFLCNMILSGNCNGWPDNLYGYGISNACYAVKAAKRWTA